MRVVTVRIEFGCSFQRDDAVVVTDVVAVADDGVTGDDGSPAEVHWRVDALVFGDAGKQCPRVCIVARDGDGGLSGDAANCFHAVESSGYLVWNQPRPV